MPHKEVRNNKGHIKRKDSYFDQIKLLMISKIFRFFCSSCTFVGDIIDCYHYLPQRFCLKIKTRDYISYSKFPILWNKTEGLRGNKEGEYC